MSSTQALLEKLKQRMPWNRPPSSIASPSANQMPFPQSSLGVMPQNKINPMPQNQVLSPLQGLIYTN